MDNGLSDGTGELAKEAGAEVIFAPKRGYGRAFKAGFAHARGNIIAMVDADATYPAEDIPRLVGILEQEKLDCLTSNRFALKTPTSDKGEDLSLAHQLKRKPGEYYRSH